MYHHEVRNFPPIWWHSVTISKSEVEPVDCSNLAGNNRNCDRRGAGAVRLSSQQVSHPLTYYPRCCTSSSHFQTRGCWGFECHDQVFSCPVQLVWRQDFDQFKFDIKPGRQSIIGVDKAKLKYTSEPLRPHLRVLLGSSLFRILDSVSDLHNILLRVLKIIWRENSFKLY